MRDSRREYPARPVVGVGAVVFVEAGADRGVVLIKRRYPPLAGEWSLPGGVVEVGETLEAAIAREVIEETGLVVEVGAVVDVFDRIMRDDRDHVQYHFVLVDYRCRAIGGCLAPGSDVSEAIVADPSALDAYALTDKALAVIARACAMPDQPAAPGAADPVSFRP
jgi:ADP-ribose pyrophosphatase YjhB (NUDIX family)